MRTKWRSTFGVAAAMSALVASGPVLAGGGDYKDDKNDKKQQSRLQQDRSQMQGQAQVVPSEKLIGAQVQTRDGQRLGSVEDLIFDLNHGQAALMVVSLGEEAQRDGEVVAIPFEAAQVNSEQRQVTLDLTRNEIRELKTYEDADAAELTREPAVRDAYRTLNRQPYWERQGQVFGFERETSQRKTSEQQRYDEQYGSERDRDRMSEQRYDEQQRSQMRSQREFEGEQHIGMDPDHARDRQRAEWQIDRGAREQFMGGYDSERVDTSRQDDRRMTGDRDQSQRWQQTQRSQRPSQQQRQLWLSRADDLQDLRVESRDGREIAQIEDLVINTRDGRIAYVILDYEGADDRQAAVPFSALRPNLQEESLVLQADRQQLDRVAFRSGQLPDFEDEQWARRVHQEFRQEQAFEEIYAFPREQRFDQRDRGMDQQRWQQEQRSEQRRWQQEQRSEQRQLHQQQQGEQRIRRQGQADYDRLFQQARQERIQGEIVNVSRLQGSDGQEHTVLAIEGERDGQISYVDVGTRSQLQSQGIEFRPGQQVNVTGQRVSILQASEIQTDQDRIRIEDQQTQQRED